MSKAARIFSSISASNVSSESSRLVSRQDDRHELISVALFSGIGLLVSLVVVLLGVQGVWI